MTIAHPNGLVDLDPLPELPPDAAEAGYNALLLALAQGAPLLQDPYAMAKLANHDRLMFNKMPILCSGPRGVLDISKVTL
jgi:hypothetical protein